MFYPQIHAVERTIRLLIRHSKHYRPFKPDKNYAVISKQLTTLFQQTNHFLKSLEVEYWITYGTLLGYYRDRKIILGDKDIDFGVHEKYYQKIWQSRNLLPPEFKMYDTSFRHYGPKLYVTYDGWEADIYFYQEQTDYLQTHENTFSCYRKPFPKDYIYPCQEAEFLGEITKIPHQVEAYLNHTYHYLGEDSVQDKKTGYWYKK